MDNNTTIARSEVTKPKLHSLRQITALTLCVVGITHLASVISSHNSNGYPLVLITSSIILLVGALIASPDIMPKIFGKQAHCAEKPAIVLSLALITVPIAYGTYFAIYNTHDLVEKTVPIPDRAGVIERITTYKDNDLLDEAMSKAMIYAEYNDPKVNDLIHELHLLKREKENTSRANKLLRKLNETPTYLTERRYEIYAKLLGLEPENVLYQEGYKRYRDKLFEQKSRIAKFSNVIGELPTPGKDGHYELIYPYLSARYPDAEVFINECGTPEPSDNGWRITCSMDALKGNYLYRDTTLTFYISDGELDDSPLYISLKKVL